MKHRDIYIHSSDLITILMESMDDSVVNHWTEIINSPDDGGWYIQQNREDGKYRVSKRTFGNYAEARKAHFRGKVAWEKWQ